jgi:hypothetical protein
MILVALIRIQRASNFRQRLLSLSIFFCQKDKMYAKFLKNSFQSTGTIEIFSGLTYLTAYRPVSIKRPDLNFSQKSLLNVRYDRENEDLNILSTRSYNRMVRVLGLVCTLVTHANSEKSSLPGVCCGFMLPQLKMKQI